MDGELNPLILNETCQNSNSEVQIPIEPTSAHSLEKKKGILSLLSINSLVCGVEIVSSCAFTYIPPLLLRSGFSEVSMTIILGVAPFIDMITVPVLAEWSDNSTLRFGRRRPVILGLSIILFVALALIPCSSKITSLVTSDYNSNIHMIILAVGVILLDYSYQAIFNPCEALLSDLMTSCDHTSQTLGFSIYSACLSLGCIIGYLIVCIKWTSIVPLNLYQDQICFLLMTILLLPCLALTLSNKEVPIQSFPKIEKISAEPVYKNQRCKFFSVNKLLKRFSLSSVAKHYCAFCKCRTFFSSNVFLCLSIPFIKFFTFAKNIVLFGFSITMKILSLPMGCYRRVQASPVVIQRIFLVELFGWTALHCHDRFFTDFVGQYIFGGDPNAKENSTLAVLYDEGIQMGSWCLFLQSFAACLYAFFIQQHLVHLIGSRSVFLGGIFVFFLSMLLTTMVSSINCLKIVTALSGIGTAAITTTPNMLVTLYFQKKEIYMRNSSDEAGGAYANRGLGTEVAVLDTAYYLSQIVLSFFLGPLVEVFRSSLLYIVVSTVASAITLYFASRVVFSPQEFKLVLEGKF